jgi:hypothetical protein
MVVMGRRFLCGRGIGAGMQGQARAWSGASEPPDGKLWTRWRPDWDSAVSEARNAEIRAFPGRFVDGLARFWCIEACMPGKIWPCIEKGRHLFDRDKAAIYWVMDRLHTLHMPIYGARKVPYVVFHRGCEQHLVLVFEKNS